MQTTGSQVLVKIVKNKHAPPFRTVEFELEFGKGISRESEILELGLKHKLIKKSGSFYAINGETIHGKDACKKYLAANLDVRDELTAKLREKFIDAEPDKENEAADLEDVDGKILEEEEVVATDTTDEEVVTAVEA